MASTLSSTEQNYTTQERMRSALWAGIMGDAMGVPVENSTRGELSLCAVKNMLGFGRYDQPRGTWSDDTSMTLCTVENLCDGYDLDEMTRLFCAWLFDGHWTATGYVFDAGITTYTALDNFRSKKMSAHECGLGGEDDNGNGALMRILPAALYFFREPVDTFLQKIHAITAITHAHPRARIASGIYALLVRALLWQKPKKEAWHAALSQALGYYKPRQEFTGELRHFMRILSQEISDLPKDEIVSSGYAVETLESSLWCFLRLDTTAAIILEAVNLGLDTDTTGMVAGGLAGACYGLEGVPLEWRECIARRNEIHNLIETFVSRAVSEQAVS